MARHQFLIAVGLLIGFGLGIVGCYRSEVDPALKKAREQSARASDAVEKKRPRSKVVPPNAESVSVSTQIETASTSADEVVLPNSDSKPQPIYRPDDQRPNHDDRRLAELGIRLFESKRLKLYTDIATEAARELPGIIDAVYPAWVAYFGDLPPDRAKTDFQMTGYLIRDEALFREAGLVPEDLPMFEHGRHRKNEFWMREQDYDYFRRHLLIHEATHCFMTYMPGSNAPVWYIEGMAEHFATHRVHSDGTVEFRVMPDQRENFKGWGRITGISTEMSSGRPKSVDDITNIPANDFLNPVPYSWAWGLCHFMDAHPNYTKKFRELGQHMLNGAFTSAWSERFDARKGELGLEWRLFTLNACYGYDVPRAAIDFDSFRATDHGRVTEKVEIVADRGWQSSHFKVEPNKRYSITATGRCTLADEPKPWVSEPSGISIRYFEGRLIGQLVACVFEEDADPMPQANAATFGKEADAVKKAFAVGSQATFEATHSGTLCFRVNDAWNSLKDNRGAYLVTVTPTPVLK